MIKLLSILVATMLLPAIYLSEPIQSASATGGGVDLAALIQPYIDRAIQAINDGNMDKALYELDGAQKELSDMFDAELEEEKNES